MKNNFTFDKNNLMAVELISISEYLDRSDFSSRQLVLYYINEGKPLPNVVKAEMVGGQYVLHYEKSRSKNNSKKVA